MTRAYLMGIKTAWSGDEAERHGCKGGESMLVCAERDGYIVTLYRPERVQAFVPVDATEEQIRAIVREACETLNRELKERLP